MTSMLLSIFCVKVRTKMGMVLTRSWWRGIQRIYEWWTGSNGYMVDGIQRIYGGWWMGSEAHKAVAVSKSEQAMYGSATLSALATLGAHSPVLHCLHWLHLEPTHLVNLCRVVIHPEAVQQFQLRAPNVFNVDL
jgi:hypothetical protein